MADSVRYIMDKWAPTFNKLEGAEVFSGVEVKSIIKTTTDFEYTLKRRELQPADYMKYLLYEVNLDKLRSVRSKHIESKLGSNKEKKAELRNIEAQFIRHVCYVFERATRRFPTDMGVGFWTEYVAYLQTTRSSNILQSVLGKALSLYPKHEEFYIMAAVHEIDVNQNAQAARIVLQRGIRAMGKTSSSSDGNTNLWLRYFELELWNAARITERQKVLSLDVNDDALVKGAPLVVFRHALKEVSSSNLDLGIVLRMYDSSKGLSSDLLTAMEAEMKKAATKQGGTDEGTYVSASDAIRIWKYLATVYVSTALGQAPGQEAEVEAEAEADEEENSDEDEDGEKSEEGAKKARNKRARTVDTVALTPKDAAVSLTACCSAVDQCVRLLTEAEKHLAHTEGTDEGESNEPNVGFVAMAVDVLNTTLGRVQSVVDNLPSDALRPTLPEPKKSKATKKAKVDEPKHERERLVASIDTMNSFVGDLLEWALETNKARTIGLHPLDFGMRLAQLRTHLFLEHLDQQSVEESKGSEGARLTEWLKDARKALVSFSQTEPSSGGKGVITSGSSSSSSGSGSGSSSPLSTPLEQQILPLLRCWSETVDFLLSHLSGNSDIGSDSALSGSESVDLNVKQVLQLVVEADRGGQYSMAPLLACTGRGGRLLLRAIHLLSLDTTNPSNKTLGTDLFKAVISFVPRGLMRAAVTSGVASGDRDGPLSKGQWCELYLKAVVLSSASSTSSPSSPSSSSSSSSLSSKKKKKKKKTCIDRNTAYFVEFEAAYSWVINEMKNKPHLFARGEGQTADDQGLRNFFSISLHFMSHYCMYSLPVDVSSGVGVCGSIADEVLEESELVHIRKTVFGGGKGGKTTGPVVDRINEAHTVTSLYKSIAERAIATFPKEGVFWDGLEEIERYVVGDHKAANHVKWRKGVSMSK